MNKIRVLDVSVAKLIAAGEVVERPASVIKELMENSLDAGASKITVEIKNGGITYMRVTDDGGGIDFADLPNAFVRHATSKVETAEDLGRILTFGFRGEALASVAAMCKVEMLSCTGSDEIGAKYVIEGMQEKIHERAGCPKGTTIIVRDLFFNTPARMKFLKKDATEAAAVARIAEKTALSNPSVSVRFIKDGKTVLTTPGNGNFKDTIHAVCGAEFANAVVELKSSESERGGVRIHGFVTRPEGARSTRGMQTFYVNGRYINSKTIAAALEEAYKGSLMQGKFPGCVLFAEISPETLDVNVHPAKTEVRFSNEKLVFDSVYAAVKNTLDSLAREKFVSAHKREYNEFQLSEKIYGESEQQKLTAREYRDMYVERPRTGPPAYSAPERPRSKFPAAAPAQTGTNSVMWARDTGSYQTLSETGYSVKITSPPTKEIPPVRDRSVKTTPNIPAQTVPTESVPRETAEISFKYIGEVFATYFIAEAGDKIYIVDKHAAHERIIYNKLSAEYGSGGVARQILLSPVVITPPREEHAALIAAWEKLLDAGFAAEDFGGGSIIVREIPLGTDREEISDTLGEIAGMLIQNKSELRTESVVALLASVACKSAVRAGDKTSSGEAEEVIKKVFSDPEVRYCPHGRPVVSEISKYTLEKMFGRII